MREIGPGNPERDSRINLIAAALEDIIPKGRLLLYQPEPGKDKEVSVHSVCEAAAKEIFGTLEAAVALDVAVERTGREREEAAADALAAALRDGSSRSAAAALLIYERALTERPPT